MYQVEIPDQREYWEQDHERRQYEFAELAYKPNDFLLNCAKWIKKGCSVLEIGSGVGRDARYLDTRMACKVTAVDIAFFPLKQLQKFSLEDGSLNTMPLVADMRHIPFDQSPKFDVLYSRSTLHLSDDELVSFFRSVLPMLTDNAKIMIQGKPEEDYKIQRSRPVNHSGLVLDTDGHLRRLWDKEKSLEIFQTLGLKVLEVEQTTETWQEKETNFIHFILEK